jgi:hypothetical protein
MNMVKQLFARCPACLHNFFNLYCYFTSGPDHSQFVYVNNTGTWTDPLTNKSRPVVLQVSATSTFN